MLVGLETGVERVVAGPPVPVAPVALVVVVDTAGLTACFGLDVLVGVAAFRAAVVDGSAAPRFSANVSVLPGDCCVVEGAREVLRAAAASGFFCSSPDPPIDGRDLCAEVAEETEVALLAGFRTTNPAAGRVGGLLRPPVGLVAWAAEEAVGFIAEDVADVAGRLAVVAAGRFGGTFSCFVPFAAAFGVAVFSVPVSASDAIAVAFSPDRAATGDSAGGTSGASTSAML